MQPGNPPPPPAPRNIIVLNGANGAAIEMRPLCEALMPYGRVWSPNLIGHGGRPVPPRLSLHEMAVDLIAFMDHKGIDRAVIVGYSIGGLIGLYLARHWPQRIVGVCGIATKYRIDRATAERWVYLGDPERIGRPGNPRAAELEAMHKPQDWRQVSLTNNRWYVDLHENPPLNDADLAAITVPVMLVSGTQDPIVTVEEQEALARLVRSRLAIWPGVMHPIAMAPLAMPVQVGNWMQELPA